MYFYLNINDHENDLNKHFYFNWSYSNSQHTLVESYFYIATGRLFPPGTPVSSYFYIATSRWFSPGTPVSSTITTDRHGIAEILLKVALKTIIHPPKPYVLHSVIFPYRCKNYI